MADITPVVMPKWGLAMQEGLVASWHVEPGARVTKGQPLCDIETAKIANLLESPAEGMVRRILAEPGTTVPVGQLLAVLAEPEVDEAALDAFVAEFAQRFRDRVAAEAAAPHPRHVTVGDRRIRVLELGEGGEPVLFVHGFGGDLDNWLFNQPELAARRRTVALDLPGHGGSSKDVGAGTVEALTEVVLATMDVLDLARVHLVGHSLGGAVALALALARPQRVASLSLVAPAGLGPEIAMAYIEGFLGTNRARKLRPVLEMLVHDPSLVTAEMVENVLRAKRLDGAEAALRTIAEACFGGGRQRWSARERLAELALPAQIVWGEEDRIVPPAHASGLPEAIAVHRLAGAGHLVHMEKAAEVNGLIARLIG